MVLDLKTFCKLFKETNPQNLISKIKLNSHLNEYPKKNNNELNEISLEDSVSNLTIVTPQGKFLIKELRKTLKTYPKSIWFLQSLSNIEFSATLSYSKLFIDSSIKEDMPHEFYNDLWKIIRGNFLLN